MNSHTDVLFEEIPGKSGNLGVIILNRPKALNSLTHGMIHAMYHQLKLWATAPHIKAVIIRSAEGRAFCAGGDLRSTYERFKQHDPTLVNFFHDEYQLNRFIFHFPKPYIALLDGITMGGGVGISIHGSHRIATDQLVFAMPETGIGFFPDVGGTYFLPRLKGHSGFYLGLTGARLHVDDCLALNIVQEKVHSEKLPNIVDAIAQHKFGTDARETVTQIIKSFREPEKTPHLLAHQSAIDSCFSAHTIETVYHDLQLSADTLCKEAAVTLTKKSPTSLKITLKALQEGKRLDFDSCMRQEFRLVTRFLQGHDFAEGIRAVLIDKDQTPRWNPPTLKEVDMQEVEKYFAPLTEELV